MTAKIHTKKESGKLITFDFKIITIKALNYADFREKCFKEEIGH
jgi:hypothetical protein